MERAVNERGIRRHSACISRRRYDQRGSGRRSRDELGLYLTEAALHSPGKFNRFLEHLGLYLTHRRFFVSLPFLPPRALIPRVSLPPGFYRVFVVVFPVAGIFLSVAPVVLLFSQFLTRNGTGPLTITHPWIGNKTPPAIPTCLLRHRSALLRHLR